MQYADSYVLKSQKLVAAYFTNLQMPYAQSLLWSPTIHSETKILMMIILEVAKLRDADSDSAVSSPSTCKTKYCGEPP